MKVTQISVFLENRKGRLYDVCSLLGKNKINIRALSIGETDEFGILRMVVDKPEEAMRILKANSLAANLTDIVALEIDDQPGGLAKILKILSENNINVEYMYGFVEKASEKALLVFRFEKTDAAIETLMKNKIKVVGKTEIANL